MADSVEGARRRFIDEARKTALAVPGPRTAAESAEIAWERRNPAGYVEVAQDHTRVTLWNFAVGSAQLKPSHRWALRTAMTSWIGEDVAVTVTGSASRSGSEATNLELLAPEEVLVGVAGCRAHWWSAPGLRGQPATTVMRCRL
jgi:outer membrane protein OmpA-like peptidoglycan-associated protein